MLVHTLSDSGTILTLVYMLFISLILGTFKVSALVECRYRINE